MSNVIQLKPKKKTEDEESEELTLDDIIEKNRKNRERMKRERDAKNKQTLRQYRIKH